MVLYSMLRQAGQLYLGGLGPADISMVCMIQPCACHTAVRAVHYGRAKLARVARLLYVLLPMCAAGQVATPLEEAAEADATVKI